MGNTTTKSSSRKIQLLLDSDAEFPQKLKQHFVFKSDQVSNPFKFIQGLLSKKVLCDGSNDSEENLGLKETMVRLAMMMACAKGAQGIRGLMEALEESGNSQLISDFQAWIKQDFGSAIEKQLSVLQIHQPEEAGSSARTKTTEVRAAEAREVKEPSSCGAKFVDKIMSRVDDDLMKQLQGHFIGRAYEIVNATEFRSSLVNMKVLDESDVQVATGPESMEGQWTENFIKAACSKKAIGSLVVAFQNSDNERILIEASEWLETSYLRKKNDPISAESLARQPRPTATGLFAATDEGLICLCLRTMQTVALTSEKAFAVAVNQNLKKVYWTESGPKSQIRRSNFDGSAKETVVPQTGGGIYALAIDNVSGNVYFAEYNSHEIKVCNAVGENCAVVISNSSWVNKPADVALDSEKGLIYWCNQGSSPPSVVRANLDGSNYKTISTGLQVLSGITLGRPSNGILYWADYGACTIGTFDVNDGKKRTLVQTNSRPWGIQVDGDKIYFSYFWGKTIQSVDKDSGEELETMFTFTGSVTHLALFNAPDNFIDGLLSEGVLCDGSDDSEADFGSKEIMFPLALMIASAKGAEGIGGLMEAFEESGNSQVIPEFKDWIKQKFGTGTQSIFGQPEEAGSSAQASKSEVVAAEASKNNEPSSCGAKWVDKIMSRMQDDLMEQLQVQFGVGPTATGLFAATDEGLISLDLRTLQATALTNGKTLAVAVNQNLEKVYWSEGCPKSQIRRSNFDGSAKETVVPQTGDRIYALTIDGSSGNVYFAEYNSHEIKVCNAVGENCAVVISNSSLVNKPVSIALDSEQGFIYWCNQGSSPTSVARKNLYGSNCIIISTEFIGICGITLDGPSNGMLYWADYGARIIGTIDVNDGKKRTLVETNSQPCGIQVDDVKIYFSTFGGGTIQSVDKNSGKELTTIFKSTGNVGHLALFNAPVTQPGTFKF